MLVRFEPPPERLRRFFVGPLGPHIESFAKAITQQGYRPAVGWRKIYLVAELSRWLERRHVPLSDLEERHIAVFLESRWRRVARRCGEATLMLLLQHLQETKLVRSPAAAPLNELGMLEQEYGRYLTLERGLMQSTVDLYQRMVWPFVSGQLKHGKFRWKNLAA